MVHQDQKRKANEQIKILLVEGFNSGTATEMTTQDWQDVRQAVSEKIL
jgi:antitoxin ParD1/3/4